MASALATAILLANLNSFATSGMGSEWTLSDIGGKKSLSTSITTKDVKELEEWLKTKDFNNLPKFVKRSLRNSRGSSDWSRTTSPFESESDIDLGEFGDVIKDLAKKGNSRGRKLFKRSSEGTKKSERRGTRKGKKNTQTRNVDLGGPEGWTPTASWTTWKK